MMKYIGFAILMSVGAYATLNDVDKAMVWPKNILKNPGMENGKQSWTASGGAFSIANASTYATFLLTGQVSSLWDASASTQTFSSAAITIPNGLKGKNGVVACKTIVPSGTATHTIEAYDGTNILGAVTITSSTSPVYQFSNFIFPSSGTIRARLQAQADEPAIGIDDCFLGDASEVNISYIAQATFIGSGYYNTTAACQWTRTNTAIGAYGTDTDCPVLTVELNPGPGTIQTTDADLPQMTVNNLPPGTYQVTVNIPALSDGSGATRTYALSDGTTTSGYGSGMGVASSVEGIAVMGTFIYTTAGNRTFSVYAASSAGAALIDLANGARKLHFSLYRFPTSSQQAYTTDQSDYGWTAYTPTGSWSTNTTYTGFHRRINGTLELDIKIALAGAPTAASLTVNLPTGLVIDTTKIAEATQNVSALPGVASIRDAAPENYTGMIRYNDTTSIAIFKDDGDGTISVVNATAPITFASGDSIAIKVAGLPITGWQSTSRAPQLINSVVNTSTGVTRTEAAEINCDAGSSIVSQLGNWVASVGNVSAGACVVTFVTGTFSAAPYCVANEVSANPAGLYGMPTVSSTSVTVDCDAAASGADCTSNNFILRCEGAK